MEPANGMAGGVVAEFNPFHSGHALLLRKAREAGCTHLAVVMSGNYTQRGEAACLRKEARVRAALLCGADLVLELPLPWAVASAERFAAGAVGVLEALGCLDLLFFGSECGDTARLQGCARRVLELDGGEALARELSSGKSFPQARAAALGGEAAELLRSPNDTLGVEYCKALLRQNARMRPLAVPRQGAAHDAPPEGGAIASASALRELLARGELSRAADFVPAPAWEIYERELREGMGPFLPARMEPLLLGQLRRLAPADFLRLPDVSEGLENRLWRAARASCSVEELYAAVKTKRYALSRIRRVFLCAFLGVQKEWAARPAPYLRVLGMNARGGELLRRARRTARLPICARHADFARAGVEARRVYALECRAADLYALCLPRALPCGQEERYAPVRLDTEKPAGTEDQT